MAKKEKKKEEGVQEEKKEGKGWGVGELPTDFRPCIVKGDVVLDVNAALALVLNNQEEILKTLGES